MIRKLGAEMWLSCHPDLPRSQQLLISSMIVSLWTHCRNLDGRHDVEVVPLPSPWSVLVLIILVGGWKLGQSPWFAAYLKAHFPPPSYVIPIWGCWGRSSIHLESGIIRMQMISCCTSCPWATKPCGQSLVPVPGGGWGVWLLMGKNS